MQVTFADDPSADPDRALEYATVPAAWRDALREFVADRAAPFLPPGATLDVHFTRVLLAGRREPWRRAEFAGVRIVRDLYPPRIDVAFRLSMPDGASPRAGTCPLTDLEFQRNAQAQPRATRCATRNR